MLLALSKPRVSAGIGGMVLRFCFRRETLPHNGKVGIFDRNNELVKGLDYGLDSKNDPPTINLHVWTQLEDESQITDPDKHPKMSTRVLVDLFQHLEMAGTKSLSINDGFSTQLQTPAGIRYPELMSLAEKFVLLQPLASRQNQNILCTGKTCGHGGNVFFNT